MKKIVISLIIFCSILSFSSAQQTITTASSFFQSVSERYAGIKDYEASVKIEAPGAKKEDKNRMEGKVSFKRPNLLRIDFDIPEKQVIVYNGEQLTIYLPGSDAVLVQSVGSEGGSASGASLATPQGLYLMSRYYYVAYESGQEPVPLSNDSDEQVIKLILTRKNASEGFRTIRLAINPETKLIRQVEALSNSNETFSFSFTNYNLNSNIPDVRFIYDAPSSANNYNNFLFTE